MIKFKNKINNNFEVEKKFIINWKLIKIKNNIIMIKYFGLSQLMGLLKNSQSLYKSYPKFLFSIPKNPLKTPKPTMSEYEAIKNR